MVLITPHRPAKPPVTSTISSGVPSLPTAGANADEVRVDDQPQDRQDTPPSSSR